MSTSSNKRDSSRGKKPGKTAPSPLNRSRSTPKEKGDAVAAASPTKNSRREKGNRHLNLKRKTKPKQTTIQRQSSETTDGQHQSGKNDSIASRLVELVHGLSGVEFFATPDDRGYATVHGIGGTRTETLRLQSKRFERWLQGLAYKNSIVGVSDSTLKIVVSMLEAAAIYSDRPRRNVYNRVAPGSEETIWIDLSNDAGEVIHVTPNGWTIERSSEVRFVRRQGQMPLPTPKRGGSLGQLRPFCNVASTDWPLLIGFLIGMYRPSGPYPLLALFGEQGTAKSTLSRMIRSLIDPSTAPLRTPPRDDRDLMIAASSNWLLVFDNLSHLNNWLSDGFCRLSTGGAFCTRQLYSNDEEVLLEAMRPCIINGIEEIVTRSDLLDRAMVLELQTIPSNQRRTEADLRREFEKVQPQILGAVLDALVVAIKRLPSIQLSNPPRLADFATFIVAAEPAMGLREGEFMEAYKRNRSEANVLALESSPISPFITHLAEEEFKGTATQLLEKYRGERNPSAGHNDPRTSGAMSSALRRLLPNFRAEGIEITFSRIPGGNRSRIIEIRKSPESCVPLRPTQRNVRKDSRDVPGRSGRKNPTKNAVLRRPSKP